MEIKKQCLCLEHCNLNPGEVALGLGDTAGCLSHAHMPAIYYGSVTNQTQDQVSQFLLLKIDTSRKEVQYYLEEGGLER